ncbi:unnamed protein product [Ostreobium quekettii]|uniref:Protein kinase domain-containing protein n=1 Tax=Ostreobium quekettii TaxID=121088 RepID=A0A8S1IZ37_9CHLO|nr:unnamed protein product [Ostreobium quekettii]|eukprot:evm.model.scf_1529.3 EVM.evm.TU.scf_1529.3   scf_1529:14677-18277(-)
MKRLLRCLRPAPSFEEPSPGGTGPRKGADDVRGRQAFGCDTLPIEQNPDKERVKQMCKSVQGRKVRRVYELGDKIGSGGFATVVGALHKGSGKEYACKIIKLPKAGCREPGELMSRDQVLREIHIASALQHDNVVRLKEFFLSKKKAYVIMEMMFGGSLVNYIVKKGPLSEEEARLVFAQVLQGISYLHKKNVIHRDVKLENILLAFPDDLRNVKLTDFGLSKVCQNVTGTRVGTPEYAAPDMYQSGDNRQFYGKSVDMWAAGVTLYCMLAGKQPFRGGGADSEVMLQRIVHADYEFDGPLWDGISESAKDLISSLLVCDSNKRLTAEAALKHPWLAR